MLFPTVDFAVFFSIVLAVNWLLPAFSLRWKLFILAASYVFYGYWDWHFVGLIAASTLVNWLIAAGLSRHVSRRWRIVWLVGAVVYNLAVLGFFKYYGFFLTSLTNALAPLHLTPALPVLQVVLPVGISFFSFQALSYVIDVFRGTIRPYSLLDFAVYLAFFPHVIAGPIVRAAEFIPQMRRTGYERRLDAGRALVLILSGVFKKVVLATFLATNLVDAVFNSPQNHSSPEIVAAVYGYAVQIYADFSGYTDIAIGCALLLGIRFPDNFDAPYTATSLQDFWHRWHMTLSRWLRDYLYIPLGGSRRRGWRTYRNLLITMLLGGLWHGAAWTFVIWGGIHGCGLAVERFWQERQQQRRATLQARRAVRLPGGVVLRRLATFHAVCLAWLFFRADSLGTVWQLITRMVTARGPSPALTPAIVLAIGAGIGSQYVPRDLLGRVVAGLSRLRPAVQGAGLAAALVVIGALGPEGTAPFIYFRF